jgi:hypothetical protein
MEGGGGEKAMANGPDLRWIWEDDTESPQSASRDIVKLRTAELDDYPAHQRSLLVLAGAIMMLMMHITSVRAHSPLSVDPFSWVIFLVIAFL